MAQNPAVDRSARRIAGMLAVIAWSGVLFQLVALLYNLRNQPHPVLETLDWFFSFFTNLTNTLVAVVITTIALHMGKSRRPTRFGSSLAAASVVYIVVVGVIYVVVLRPKNGPGGLGMLADVIMHYAMPIAYPIFWLKVVEKSNLTPSQSWYWTIYPIAYGTLTALRGSLTGWYPYPFLAASHMGYPLFLLLAAGFVALFKSLGMAVMWIDRNLKKPVDRVAIDESV